MKEKADQPPLWPGSGSLDVELGWVCPERLSEHLQEETASAQFAEGMKFQEKRQAKAMETDF